MPEETGGVRAVEAVTRLDRFLRKSVETPLLSGLASDDAEELRTEVERALSALEGLHFLVDRSAGERAIHDLGSLVHDAVAEYPGGSDLTVDVSVPDEEVQVRVDGDGVGDALFLILHNAERHGGGTLVHVTVMAGEPYASVLVEDEGPGFTAEALTRAYDPFYSTSETGLGLGLPQARHLIQAAGGEIKIGNGRRGGRVELFLPVA